MKILIADCSTFTLGISIQVLKDGELVFTDKIITGSIGEQLITIATEKNIDTIYLLGSKNLVEKIKKDIESISNIPIYLMKAGN